MSGDQDWDTVVIRTNLSSSTKAGKNARRADGKTSTEVRGSGPTGDHKLDDASDSQKIATVSLSLQKRIQQARTAKGMTQKELATRINEKPGVINEYECGKAIPNNQILGKMERILGTKLRGKPAAGGKKKGGTKKQGGAAPAKKKGSGNTSSYASAQGNALGL